MRIKKVFADKGISFYVESVTNRQFAILSERRMEMLAKRHIFEYRFRTSETHHWCASAQAGAHGRKTWKYS